MKTLTILFLVGCNAEYPISSSEQALVDVDGFVVTRSSGCSIEQSDTDLGLTTVTADCIQYRAINTAAPSGSSEQLGPKPGGLYQSIGRVYDPTISAARDDEWSFGATPLDNGSDTGRFTFWHRRNVSSSFAGNKYSAAFNVITQENPGAGQGELILNTAYRSMCHYLGETGAVGARGYLAYLCMQNNVLKFGASLYSYGRLTVGHYGLQPQIDAKNSGTAALGQPTYRFDGLYNAGALTGNYVTASGTTYGLSSKDYFISMTNSAARTVSLVTADTAAEGQVIIIKDAAGTAGSANVTINRASSNTIDGATSYVINTNYGSVSLISNGTNAWFVMGSN
jgi:hypothetical protein